MSRRTAICLLATIVSFAATQPVSGGAPRTGESAAIVLLARARTQKTIEREADSRPLRFPIQKHATPVRPNPASQFFFSDLQSRAPPALSSAI
ncbi:MAG: hypothetical protein LAP21_17305 [Acidobacteriia bacterium]|nr:hypothetical protein [Terriglobia bacterium]